MLNLLLASFGLSRLSHLTPGARDTLFTQHLPAARFATRTVAARAHAARRSLLCLAAALCLQLPHSALCQQLLSTHARQQPESELIFGGEGCFGHYHIFGYSWWSELYTGGVEYDRHSWDYFLKAQMDYSAEVLPIATLVQPANTNVFGDPLSTARETIHGIGIYPIGLRMKWRHDKGFQPYFIVKGGLLVFEHKALSRDGAYANFSLQTGIGMQRRLTPRIDMRVGLADIHFSDAFIVPANPGLDVMSYNGGLVYHFGK